LIFNILFFNFLFLTLIFQTKNGKKKKLPFPEKK